MRLRLIGLAVLALVTTSLVVSPAATSDTDSYPITVETAFSDPVLGLNTSAANMDRGAALEAMRIIKCAYREPAQTDAPGECNGQLRSASHVRLDFTMDVVDNIRTDDWDPDDDGASSEETLYAALKLLMKDQGAQGRFFYSGYASGSSKNPSYHLRKYVFNNSGGDLFIACDDKTSGSKGKGCLSGGGGAHMHIKSFVIRSVDPNNYATLTRDGKPAKNAVVVTSSNMGGRAYNQVSNNTTIVYNDDQLTNGVVFGYDTMRSRNTKKYKKQGNHQFYSPTSFNNYWPTSTAGMFLGSDSEANGGLTSHSRATRVLMLPTKSTSQDPLLAILKQIEPDDQCEIKVMHNRFKLRRAVIAEKLVELSRGGCDIELMAFKDAKGAAAQGIHCNNAVRICPPILGVLRQGDDIQVYATAIHDKSFMIQARFKGGNGNLETVVQSGSASLTHLNIVASDEIVTFNWNRDTYDAFRDHWETIKYRSDTCKVDMQTFKLGNTTANVDSYTYCRKFN